MNTPVSFPIAKLLKEKGFDKVCYRAFLFKTYQPSNIYHENIETIKNAENFSDSHYEKYYRPTIAEVVMWLYEKHEIWITVGVDSLFYKGKHHILVYKNHGYGLELSSIENTLHGPYNSPTEAYEAAIEYVLKNLI